MALVFAEARHALDQQATERDDLRTRAAALVAVASVVATLLGGPVLHGRLGPATWVALGAFAMLAAGCVSVLVPTRNWAARHTAKRMLSYYVYAQPPRTIDEMRRDLALRLDEHVDGNVLRLRRMAAVVQGSCMLLIVEIAALLVALRGRG